jgi:hypothetical protein
MLPLVRQSDETPVEDYPSNAGAEEEKEKGGRQANVLFSATRLRRTPAIHD